MLWFGSVFSWCALDGHQRSLCLFVEHMDGCLLLGSCAIVISLLFQFLHLCLPRYPPRLSPYLFSLCLQSCAVLLFMSACPVLCVCSCS